MEKEPSLKTVMDFILPKIYKTVHTSWNDAMVEKVKSRVKRQAKIEIDKGKTGFEAIIIIQKQLQAICRSVELESNAKSKSKPTLELNYSDSEKEGGKEEDFVDKIKKSTKTKNENEKKYYEYLSEYKEDPDVDSRVKALEMRGKKYLVSLDGSCPRCSHRVNTFVIMDFLEYVFARAIKGEWLFEQVQMSTFNSLFLSGDMPELLQHLITQGKAILWSSKETEAKKFFTLFGSPAVAGKDPPTFLCAGKCPSDIAKYGFNINWDTTDLTKIYLFPEKNYVKKPKPQLDNKKLKTPKSNIVPGTTQEQVDVVVDEKVEEKEEEISVEDLLDEQLNNQETKDSEKEVEAENGNEVEDESEESDESDEEYDEGNIDIEYYRNQAAWVVLDEDIQGEGLLSPEEEQRFIRTMIALEEARIDFSHGEMKKKDNQVELIDITADSPENQDSKASEKVHGNERKPEQVEQQTDSIKKQTDTQISAKDATVQLYNKIKAFEKSRDKAKESALTVIASKTSAAVSNKNQKKSFTMADFPVSKDGSCPYCRSTNVVYVIIKSEGDSDADLPELLRTLLNQGKARKVPKGDYDLPSFQCNGCTYGFNLDWASTNLEKIFLQPKPKPKPTIMPVSTVQPPVMAAVPPAPAANAYNSNYYNNSNYYDTTMYSGYHNQTPWAGSYGQYNSFQPYNVGLLPAPFPVQFFGATQPPPPPPPMAWMQPPPAPVVAPIVYTRTVKPMTSAPTPAPRNYYGNIPKSTSEPINEVIMIDDDTNKIESKVKGKPNETSDEKPNGKSNLEKEVKEDVKESENQISSENKPKDDVITDSKNEESKNQNDMDIDEIEQESESQGKNDDKVKVEESLNEISTIETKLENEAESKADVSITKTSQLEEVDINEDDKPPSKHEDQIELLRHEDVSSKTKDEIGSGTPSVTVSISKEDNQETVTISETTPTSISTSTDTVVAKRSTRRGRPKRNKPASEPIRSKRTRKAMALEVTPAPLNESEKEQVISASDKPSNIEQNFPIIETPSSTEDLETISTDGPTIFEQMEATKEKKNDMKEDANADPNSPFTDSLVNIVTNMNKSNDVVSQMDEIQDDTVEIVKETLPEIETPSTDSNDINSVEETNEDDTSVDTKLAVTKTRGRGRGRGRVRGKARGRKKK